MRPSRIVAIGGALRNPQAGASIFTASKSRSG